MTWVGQNEETKKIVLRMLSELSSILEDSREDIGRFLGLDRRRNGTELTSTNLIEKWEKTVEGMMLNFAKSGHPVFRASSASE